MKVGKRCEIMLCTARKNGYFVNEETKIYNLMRATAFEANFVQAALH